MKHLVLNSLIVAAMGALGAAAPAAAQYKWQTPDGRTVYGDVPPQAGARQMNEPGNERGAGHLLSPAAAPGTGSPAAAAPLVPLPYELKLVTGKFPVVLYAAPECGPCAAARQHLAARGVPFLEKTISTMADFEGFKSRGFSENSFPAMTVGTEKTVGFEAGAYDRLLTAAGYPRTSRLPAGYQQAVAEPMTPPQPQKLTVNVQRDAAQVKAPAAPAAPSAIDLYRQQVQAGTPARTPDGPSMRF